MPASIALPAALGHDRTDRRIAVLREIGVTGSISRAARVVGVSYKAAWQAVDTLTTLAGVPLVSRVVGGAGGGGAVLTSAGRDLLAAAQAMAQARGALLGRWPAQAQAQAGAALTPLAVQTSMRNQVPCMVRRVQQEGAMARIFLAYVLPSPRSADGAQASKAHEQSARRRAEVALPPHEQTPLIARITSESAQLLALVSGVQVQVLCKATAVRVTRRPVAGDASDAPAPAECQLDACASRVVRGALGDEVTAELLSEGLGTGRHMVGFAAAHSRLRAGSPVALYVEENALVLALANV